MREATYARTSSKNRNRYMYGATAEELERELNAQPKKKLSKRIIKNRENAIHMNPAYVIFLGVAICICAFVLIGYVRMQADITSGIEQASKLESRYISLKNDNDEEYERIVNSVDMNEVKRVAIEELGMHYAKEGQIITYADEMKDYVRLYSDVDE